jgi:hypothetical protein
VVSLKDATLILFIIMFKSPLQKNAFEIKIKWLEWEIHAPFFITRFENTASESQGREKDFGVVKPVDMQSKKEETLF